MRVMEKLRRGPARAPRPVGIVATLAFVAGAVLVIWSSYIHFHLWQKLGYRQLATIGPLFLAQAIAGVLVGLLVVGARRVWAALVGAGFALSTLIGFFISVEWGLFGFQDSSSAPYAQLALAVEIAAAAVLVVAAALCLVGSPGAAVARRGPTGVDSSRV
jgi:hypothetical protein